MGKVVLIACTNVGRSIIESLINSKEKNSAELVGIVNLKPEVAVNKANYDSYVDLVQKYNLSIFYCNNVNDDECINFIKDCNTDLIIQSGWSQKFHDDLLNLPKYGCIGEHPAPLPKGRGAACINWAIITGEKEWGDTFFKMEKEYDTGAILAQEYFNIEIYDDVKTVYDKVAYCAVNSIKKHLYDWSEGKFSSITQDSAKSTHYPRRRPQDGLFDFTQDSRSIYNQIRGQARPYPGAFFIDKNNDKKVYVWKASLDTKCIDGGYKVLCGDGKEIILLRIQPEGEPEMWAFDYFYNK